MANKAKKQLYGAVPYKCDKDDVWVLMVTSQTRKRWIFPNGNIEKGETGPQAAARETFEEAGIKGDIDKKHFIDAVIGKSSSDGIEDVAVRFYPIELSKELSKWPEKNERKRRWMKLNEAKSAVEDEDFLAVLKAFSKAKFIETLVA